MVALPSPARRVAERVRNHRVTPEKWQSELSRKQMECAGDGLIASGGSPKPPWNGK